MGKELNLKTGQIGEEIAKKYLEEKGYLVLEENYKTKYGEIDLVCKNNNELIIVEVRTKKGENFGSPEDSLIKTKLRKVWLNAEAYRNTKKWQGICRVDAICLVLKKDNSLERLNHYKNIV